MNKQNLIIFKLQSLYEIIKEVEENLNFQIFEAANEEILNNKFDNLENYLIITPKKIVGEHNQFILKQIPTKFFKLIEKINIQFHKIQFNKKSEITINQYKIDLNSRELISKNTRIKLTEKEINIIIYLSESSNAASVNQLQSEVWGYHSKLETHTVETHVYRLRKKISQTFNDDNFIISKKNGYQIN